MAAFQEAESFMIRVCASARQDAQGSQAIFHSVNQMGSFPPHYALWARGSGRKRMLFPKC